MADGEGPKLGRISARQRREKRMQHGKASPSAGAVVRTRSGDAVETNTFKAKKRPKKRVMSRKEREEQRGSSRQSTKSTRRKVKVDGPIPTQRPNPRPSAKPKSGGPKTRPKVGKGRAATGAAPKAGRSAGRPTVSGGAGRTGGGGMFKQKGVFGNRRGLVAGAKSFFKLS